MDTKETQNQNSFMDEIAGQGFDGMSAGDYAIPFLKILQVGNPECLEGDPSYVPGAKAGLFMNTLTRRLYGAEIDLIPLKYESVWLAWAPNRGGLKGRYAPGSIEVTGSQFDGMKDADGNDVVENMIFYCLVAGHLEDGPVVFPLSSTGLKHGKNWNSQIMLTRLDSGKRAPFFSSVWHLSLSLNKNDAGSWYQIGTKTTNVERKRFITQEEYAEFVAPNRQMLLADTHRVDYAQIEGPGKATRDAGPASEY